jgi:uncharacterized membrane protein YqhA
MNKILANLRYGALVAVISSFIGAALMLYVGAVKIYKAIAGYLTGTGNIIFPGTAAEKVVTHVSQEDAAIGRVVESMDAFLISLVLMYLGYGMYALFCDKDDGLSRLVPAGIVPRNLGQLKETLAQLILVVLIVLFTRNVWLNLGNLTWETLILPAGIALLALALRLADFSKGHD